MSQVNSTVLLYMAADNNLWDAGQANLADFRIALSGLAPENVDFYIFFDCGPGNEHYTLKISGNTETKINFTIDPDSGTAEVLGGFIDYVMVDTGSASDLYSLILWDHGGGISGAMEDDANHNMISVPGIVGAIEGKGISVVGFDACLMASAEVAVEFAGSGVQYLVGSEEVEGGDGWNYFALAQGLAEAATTYALADAFWQAASANPGSIPTISLVDLAYAGNLESAMNRFASAALDLDSDSFRKLVWAVNETTWFGIHDPYNVNAYADAYYSSDILGFLRMLNTRFDAESEIILAGQELAGIIEDMVIRNHAINLHRGAGGLSLFLPTSSSHFGSLSRQLAKLSVSAGNSDWLKFVQLLGNNGIDDSDHVRFVDTGLGSYALPEGGNAFDLGIYTGGGTLFMRQALFAGDEPVRYRLLVRSSEEPGADGGVFVSGQNENAEIAYRLIDIATGTLLGSGSGAGGVTIPAPLLAAGNYLIELTSNLSTYFAIRYDSPRVGTIDHFETVVDNNELVRATVCDIGYQTGLSTSAADPDYYRISAGQSRLDYLMVDGPAITGDSLTVYLYNAQTGQRWRAFWSDGSDAYVGSATGATHIMIVGNGVETVNYSFHLTASSYGNDDPRYAFTGRLDAVTTKNIFSGETGLTVNTAGFYSLAADSLVFEGVNATITIFDADNRKVASGSVKNGKLSFKQTLLRIGNYTIQVQTTNRKLEGDYSFRFQEDMLFRNANLYNDDWVDLKTSGDAGLTAVEGAPLTYTIGDHLSELFSEWVGYSDAIDYRRIDFEYDGSYTFNFNADTRIQLSVNRLVEQQDGTFKLVIIKSKNLGRGEKWEMLNGLLLEKGTYYLAVKSLDAAKGIGGQYSVYLNGANSELSLYAENSDDNWEALDERWQAWMQSPWDKIVAGDWVGFGDEIDYREFRVAESGTYSFKVESDGNLKVAISIVNAKGTLTALKTLSVSGKAGSGKLNNILLDAGNTYYVSVLSTDAKSGRSASYGIGGDGGTVCQRIDLDSPSALAFDLGKKESTRLTFDIAEADLYSFDSFREFNLKLYAYDETTNKLKAVGLRNNSATLEGTYYLDLTAKNTLSGSLAFDDGSNTFFWQAAPFSDAFSDSQRKSTLTQLA